MFRSEYCYVAHTEVGFVVAGNKNKGKHEITRWRYKIKLDVEETAKKAEEFGLTCRLLEGQAKNMRGKNGWGEGFPLNQYEIKGGALPESIKIQIGPKTTQIFLFGKTEIQTPNDLSSENLIKHIDFFENLLSEIDASEVIMNKIAVFFAEESKRFSEGTRIIEKVAGTQKILDSSRTMTDKLLEKIEKHFMSEFDAAWVEIFQGQPYLAKERLRKADEEITFWFNDFIAEAKKTNDPRVVQWEADFQKLKKYPYSIMGMF